ncbi:MAG: alkaline phosphatase family protein [Acidimicrobiales bacterium]
MGSSKFDMRLSRRAVLKAGAATGLAAACTAGLRHGDRAARASAQLRLPDSLPDLARAAGTPDPSMPFDHVVVVMMENHSFDNFLGSLSLVRPDVVGQFSYATKQPIYSNVDGAGNTVLPWRRTTTCQSGGESQSWNTSHRSMFWNFTDRPDSEYLTATYDPRSYDWSQPLSQVPLASPGMQGFVLANGGPDCMGYWTSAELPFTHSMAQAFTIANYWFCSVPAQTYPNRRFLYAGTAFGDISTDTGTIFVTSNVPPIAAPPPNGTIFDRLSHYGVPWRNYFYDLPSPGIIPTTVEKYPDHFVPLAAFFADCAAGSLPAVSFVDPESGAVGVATGEVAGLPGVGGLGPVQSVNNFGQTVNGDQEGPADMAYGEAFVAKVVNAVMHSPAWGRTLLIWTFDEHGGYADHVPPPAAIPPDGIQPQIGSGDFFGAYDIYGPRVPAVIVSPYSKPGDVSNTVYDHTSVLATIEAKWNLPACTYRDANAATVMDCLQATPSLLDPPALVPAAAPQPSGLQCSTLLPAG